MKWRYLVLLFLGLCASAWGFLYHPFFLLGENPLLDLVAYHTPRFYGWMVRWYYISPAVLVFIVGLILLAIWRVWFETRYRSLSPLGKLPVWPLSPDDEEPGIVMGEKHHPVECREISNPSWLVIPERGLYTGVAIFGAVGLADPGRKVDRVERSVRRGEGDRKLVEALHRDAEGEWD